MPKLSHQTVRRVFGRALASGNAVRHSLACVEWDISGDCQSPVTRELHGVPSAPVKVEVKLRNVGVDAWGTHHAIYEGVRRQEARKIVVTPETAVPLLVIMHAKCRKCETCRAKRAAMWRLRALSETAVSSRTWFGTLTLRPEEHFRVESLCRQRGKASCVDYDRLQDDEKFSERLKIIGPDIGRYLKRLRKESSARFRYLLVAEKHESGLPHFHCLVHEWGAPIRERTLSAQWKAGFSQWRLVPPENPRASAYICKYLSKDSRSRVRASGGYGQGPKMRPLDIGSSIG